MKTITFERFLAYVNELPKQFDIAAKEINEKMAKSLQMRIRRRAPTGFTGSLKKTEIKPEGNSLVLTAPPHWFYVNMGISPNKLLPIEFAEQHLASPGSTAGQKLWFDNPKGWFIAKSSPQGKGYVDKSLDALEKDVPQIVEMELNKALQVK